MDLANYIRYLIEENEFDADIETDYCFSNQEEIREELIKMALEDSKMKANDIAQMMGQKLVGIDSVVVGEERLRTLEYPASKKERSCCESCYDEMLSRRVKAPTTNRSESVEVVWLIE